MNECQLSIGLCWFFGVFLLLHELDPVNCIGQQADRPNILFLLVDDQRNDTIGCAGHPVVLTPNIDSLAKKGVRFENAFVTTSICAASRATILTGRYERTHGYTFGKPPLSKKLMLSSYPAVLKQNGYRTGYVGKYGVRTNEKPEGEIFDFFSSHGRNPYFKKISKEESRHETEIAGDKAIDFLKKNSKGKPFCLTVSFNAVHAEDGDKENHFPFPKAVEDLYHGQQMPLPKLRAPEVFENLPSFLKNSMNRKRFFWRWDTAEKYQKNMRNYFRMISGVDRVVGRIQKELELQKIAQNTVIIYMADNGYYMGERGFAGKWTHFEQSLRVPLIIYDPRGSNERRNRIYSQMVLNVDIPSTIVDLGKSKVPENYQGRSLIPLLEEKPTKWRTDFFCEHLMNHKDLPKWEGVRGERFVYARYFQQKPVFEFLHDLKADPDQLKNLRNDPRFQDKLIELRRRTDALKTKYLNAK